MLSDNLSLTGTRYAVSMVIASTSRAGLVSGVEVELAGACVRAGIT